MKFEHMLAKDIEPCFEERIYQIKYDGSRAILSNLSGKTKLINRRGTDKISNYPEILTIQLPQNTAIDGEIVFIDHPPYHCNFYKLLSRENTQDKFMIKLLMKKIPATFVAFDILMFEGRDLRQLPLRERLEILNKLSGNPEVFRICKSFENVDEVDKLIAEHNLEGKIIKKADARYVGGRSDLWVKKKVHLYDWYVVKGYKSMKREVSAICLEDLQGNLKGYVNFTGSLDMIPKLRSMWTGKIHLDHENYPYKPLQKGLMAYVQHNPADIPLLREPVLLKLEEEQ